MDKKQVGLIATISTAVCCGLPGCFSLCMGGMFAVAGSVPGADIDIGGSSEPTVAIATGIGMLCVGVIAVGIPVVVGFVTLRKPAEPAFSEPLPPPL